MKIYISGKITGNPEHVSDFARAAVYLRRYTVTNIVNPTTVGSENLTWAENMRLCIGELIKCDAIYMLKNWRDSRGAKLEREIAEAIGLFIGEEQ